MECLDEALHSIFPKLQADTWAEIQGGIETREPFETCGDAVLHVVITENLAERLRDEPEGYLVLKAIQSPLLTNATFLHFLQSGRFYKVDRSTQKHPGNTFEVFAGALAMLESLGVLKMWIKKSFENLVEGAIEVSEFQKMLRLNNQEEKGRKARTASNTGETGSDRPLKRRQRIDIRLKGGMQDTSLMASTSTVNGSLKSDEVFSISTASARRAVAEKHCNDVPVQPTPVPTRAFNFTVPIDLAWVPISGGTQTPGITFKHPGQILTSFV
ncbi:hypothetical protein K438DRAFT_1953069 [Mycena galopus ATCC 62051]|nr:hypothetical protein K438DRAFT_1953069 [Mycena galopus ATCC 62051]